MTGLDPAKDVIVEIATIVTDDELEIVAEGPDLVVHQPPEALVGMEPVVVDMHTSSGLLTAIAASTVTPGGRRRGHARVHPGARARGAHGAACAATRSAPTAGSWPRTCRRSRSTSTTDRSTSPPSRSSRVGGIPGALDGVPRKATAHRALDDIRESIDELRWYRANVFKPAEALDQPVK